MASAPAIMVLRRGQHCFAHTKAIHFVIMIVAMIVAILKQKTIFSFKIATIMRTIMLQYTDRNKAFSASRKHDCGCGACSATVCADLPACMCMAMGHHRTPCRVHCPAHRLMAKGHRWTPCSTHCPAHHVMAKGHCQSWSCVYDGLRT